MEDTKEFIKELLEKSEGEKDGVFIPNEVILKITDLKHFDQNVALKLSKIEQTILTKQYFINNGQRKEIYKVKLLKFSIIEDYISFYPIALKNYLKNI